MSGTQSNKHPNRAQHLARRRAAKIPEEPDFLTQLLGKELWLRISDFNLQPKSILIIGCGHGDFSEKCKLRYPDAQITTTDWSQEMCDLSTQHGNSSSLCDIDLLPFADDNFDLILSNGALLTHININDTCNEWLRVLKPEGWIFCSTLGPDSFKSLRSIQFNNQQTKQPNAAPLHQLLDMHNLGDTWKSPGEEYMQKGQQIMMDTTHRKIRYKSLPRLILDLRASGISNTMRLRGEGLIGREQWMLFENRILEHAAKENHDQKDSFLIDLEMVFSCIHGKINLNQKVAEPHETAVPFVVTKNFKKQNN